jgi:hypothetical protein
MRLMTTAFSVLLLALVQGCTRPADPPRQIGPSPEQLAAKERATEERLTGYFRGILTPNLRSCWERVQGTGSVAFAMTYANSGGRWTLAELHPTSSTLTADQDGIATGCVKQALAGTSFGVDKVDTAFANGAASTRFIVNWSFPVPLPADASAIMAKAPGGGAGSPASCWYCGHDLKTGDGACLAGKSGYPGCIENLSGGCVCFGGSCGSGGFGGAGGTVAMRAINPGTP